METVVDRFRSSGGQEKVFSQETSGAKTAERIYQSAQ